MNQYQEENKERIKEILCILTLLEADMEQQKEEELYLRVVKHIHNMMRNIQF